MFTLLLISFVAGVLSFVSPCIIPMLTVYFTVITGLSVGELGTSHQVPVLRRKVLINTVAFIVGFVVVFTLAGAAAGQLGALLGKWLQVLNVIGGTMVLIMALRLLGVFNLSFLERLHWEPEIFDRFRQGTKHSSLMAFVVGLVFAFACSHCIAPTLLSILMVAGASQHISSGMIIMLTFSIGLAIPYFITGLGFSRVVGKFKSTRKYQPLAAKAAGLLLLFLSYLMYTNKFLLLTTWFSKFLSYKLPIGM